MWLTSLKSQLSFWFKNACNGNFPPYTLNILSCTQKPDGAVSQFVFCMRVGSITGENTPVDLER